jgi:hypothetical protein
LTPLGLALVASLGGPARPASAQFVVPDQQYRCPAVEAQCPGSAKKLPAFEQRGSYTINFVEVMALLEKRLAERRALTTGG